MPTSFSLLTIECGLCNIKTFHIDPTKATATELFAPLEAVCRAYTSKGNKNVGDLMSGFIVMPFLCPKFSEQFNASNPTHLSEAKKLLVCIYLSVFRQFFLTLFSVVICKEHCMAI